MERGNKNKKPSAASQPRIGKSKPKVPKSKVKSKISDGKSKRFFADKSYLQAEQKNGGQEEEKSSSLGRGKSFSDKKETGKRTPGKKEDERDLERRTQYRAKKSFSDTNATPAGKKELGKRPSGKKNAAGNPNEMRLNRFLANAGVCSRREADEIITQGLVLVNGVVVSELGVKVKLSDDVRYDGQKLMAEKKIYLLMNKPKDTVTTLSDPDGRHTVYDIIKSACDERLYPVGRLDRNTTGVLLFTNDGELTARLTHPKYGKKKIYHVHLDKAVIKGDLSRLLEGIELDSEMVVADDVSYVKAGDKKQVGLEIHTGQNRVVRRLFEEMGYKVMQLDRVYFAGLTKKNIPRGKIRFLSEKEVTMLKMV